MSQQKFLIQYTNFLGQTVKDHKTFKQEGKELNKRLNELKKKSLNGKAEIVSQPIKKAPSVLNGDFDDLFDDLKHNRIG